MAEWDSPTGRPDNLTRWMAHYLAETLEAAKTETDRTRRNGLRRECADLILAIWKHREHWPRGQPFKALGTVIKEISADDSSFFPARREPKTWGSLITELEAIHRREKRCLLEAAAANEADRATGDWEKAATKYFSTTESGLASLRKRLSGKTAVTSLDAEETSAKKHRRLVKVLRELQGERARLHATVHENWFESVPAAVRKPPIRPRQSARGYQTKIPT